MFDERTTTHIKNYAADFVLDLLSLEETRLVSQHIVLCPECRQAVYLEKALHKTVRETLQVASRPDPGVLAKVRPAASTFERKPLTGSWSRRLAVVSLALLLFTLSLSFAIQRKHSVYAVSPTSHLTTLAATSTPLSTHSTKTPYDSLEGESQSTPVTLTVSAVNYPAMVPIPVAPHLP